MKLIAPVVLRTEPASRLGHSATVTAKVSSALPYWPAMMKRGTAAKYCELSPAEFEREIADGRLPMPVRLGNSEHWSRQQLDLALEILANGGQDWFSGSPLYEGKAA